ncbi:7-cyano-7-deazaguanine synthase [Helicobacter pullorum]|uniref:ATP-binding protein n=1 Tax=Helicobacter pullorum TaxID=35818 RepID=A0AAW3J2S9_9HELI|nr:7-cyano-7-deazaguanine synthase [Helicobacter pullorum]KAB0575430.1 ATP-binding protein [Helicobacter pullorum NCTC 12824]KPH49825.1 ATP-binding protein [Helicobacter pullorum]KPH51634.1 ATP-binding protein [Helicobacter pullorum]OCR04415.1 ATP-binding protein [Helicobacter pullorum]OCR07472.1 ATP-binding protein [Helicobacter pullorum]
MKALALFSGGLDSLLAIKIIKDMGIDVLALHFNIGFVGKNDKSEALKEILAQIDVPLKVIDIRKQFFDEVLFAPKYGYGKYFNPCIDCHGNMFSHAFSLLESEGASFVISGEVLGQRPKSQRAEALLQVEKLCNAQGLVVRPMSAKLLPITIPEQKGWIDRERLLDIHGRGRERQLKMVEEYGIKNYAKPGGGCLLTDTSIANKIKDLQSHREIVFEDMEMVKYGRYFILPNGGRCVIARNEEENQKLSFKHPKMSKIELLNCLGPLGLVEKDSSQEDKEMAIALTLTYGKTEMDKSYKVHFEGREVEMKPFVSKEKAREFLLNS